MSAAASVRAERGVRLAEAVREVSRREDGVHEVARRARTPDTSEPRANGAREIMAEPPELGELLGAASEDDGRGLLALLRLRGLVTGALVLEAEREVVGDVSQLLGRGAGVLAGETTDHAVDDEHHRLGGLDDGPVRRGGRAATLGAERVVHALLLGAHEGDEARRDGHAVRREERAVQRGRDLVCVPFLVGDERRGFARRVLHAPREDVDVRVAQRAKRVEANSLGLADVRRKQREGRARSPLGPGHGVVVLGFDANEHRRVAAPHEGVSRVNHRAAAVGARLAVEMGEDPPLLVHAALEHEVDLAQAVVVGCLVAHGDVALALVRRERDGLRRPLELHEGRLVGDGGDGRRVRLRNDDVAEARHDAELDGVFRRPPCDHVSPAVVDEGDLVLAVAEGEPAPAVHGFAAVREERPARDGHAAVDRFPPLLLVEVLGRSRREDGVTHIGKAQRRDAVVCHEHIEPFDDAERVRAAHAEHPCGDDDRQHVHARRGAGGLRRDAVVGQRCEATGHVEAREHRGGPVVARLAVLVEEPERAERSAGALGIGADGDALDHRAGIVPPSVPHDEDVRGARPAEHEKRDRGRTGANGAASRDEQGDDEHEQPAGDHGPPDGPPERVAPVVCEVRERVADDARRRARLLGLSFHGPSLGS